MRAVYRLLPQPVQALVALSRHVWARWPLRHAKTPGYFEGDRSLFFCSYFDNVDSKAAEEGRFHSFYWGGLHSLLSRIGYRSNWLHLYVPCAFVPTPRLAIKWTQRFNRVAEHGLHTFIDAYLSWRIVLRVIKRWIWLNFTAWRLREIKQAFTTKGTCISLWPLMRGDWYGSLCGSPAINNLLAIGLLDAALRDLPYQRKGLYLCENQAWERALIHAWRKHGHGCLIAVAHSTVRFWDTRYFFDQRSVREIGAHPMPQPNLIALNGQAAVDTYLDSGYTQEVIIECEALRYGYLSSLEIKRRSGPECGGQRKALILGDVMPLSTDRLLRLLDASTIYGSDTISYIVKPHPNCPVRVERFPSLNIAIVTNTLETIVQDYDVAYASNSTSAAVDAYLAGLPVVVMLDEAELNFSPLRGMSGVSFVSTPQELAEALRMEDRDVTRRPDGNGFFFLDPELPRWSRLLAN
jgi:surface carbohydrate biosynthesis protein (TIGR04326 family)